MLTNIMSVTRKLRRQHVATRQFYTSAERIKLGIENQYGGIPGSLTPSSLERIFVALGLVPGRDKMCDIGSGTGVVVLAAAATGVEAFGFDIDPDAVAGSLEMARRLQGVLHARVAFFQADVLAVERLSATAFYSFTGFPAMTYAASWLAASSSGGAESPGVKLAIVVVHPEHLYECGLVHEDDEDVATFAVQMPSGNSYRAFVVTMTAARCKRTLATRGRLLGDQDTNGS